MGSDTDRLPQLDEDSIDFTDTIVLSDSNVMETREMRQLLDPDAVDPGDTGDSEGE